MILRFEPLVDSLDEIIDKKFDSRAVFRKNKDVYPIVINHTKYSKCGTWVLYGDPHEAKKLTSSDIIVSLVASSIHKTKYI